jgi:transcriptional regulator with XRE-family HTH domain
MPAGADATTTKLRRVRMASGLSQVEFARLLRVAQADVSTIETGRRSPWPAFRRKAADVLRMPEADLFEDRR